MLVIHGAWAYGALHVWRRTPRCPRAHRRAVGDRHARRARTRSPSPQAS
jgi:hypothetical protein